MKEERDKLTAGVFAAWLSRCPLWARLQPTEFLLWKAFEAGVRFQAGQHDKDKDKKP